MSPKACMHFNGYKHGQKQTGPGQLREGRQGAGCSSGGWQQLSTEQIDLRSKAGQHLPHFPFPTQLCVCLATLSEEMLCAGHQQTWLSLASAWHSHQLALF